MPKEIHPLAELTSFSISLSLSLEAEIGSMCQRRSCQPTARLRSGTDPSRDLSCRHDGWDVWQRWSFQSNQDEKAGSSAAKPDLTQIFWPLFAHRFGNRSSIKFLNKKSHNEINIVIERNAGSRTEPWVLCNKFHKKKAKLTLSWCFLTRKTELLCLCHATNYSWPQTLPEVNGPPLPSLSPFSPR